MSNLFEIRDLRCSYDKCYREGSSKVVLEIHNLNIPSGLKVFIVGESGIGKSTILETLGLMNNTIVPDEKARFHFFDNENGEKYDLIDLWKSNDDSLLSEFRLKHYSFIFQSTNLMNNFTAFENVAFTRMLQGYDTESCFQKTRDVLADLGLDHVDEKRMTQELSGGQRQRLAFARAILPSFTVLFGDEPTGNLDGENAVRVMNTLSRKLDELRGASAIIVSHDMHLAVSFADMIIRIRKEIRPKTNEFDEDISYGVIDKSCMYSPTMVNDVRSWSNGSEVFTDSEFELYLRKKDMND